MPQALIGLLAVCLAVAVPWFLRYRAARWQRDRARQHEGEQAAVSSDPHDVSVTRASEDSEPCGTIDGVTSLSASISSPASGGRAGGAGLGHAAGVDAAYSPDENASERVVAELDPRLAASVDLARAAAEDETGSGSDGPVGAHVGVEPEGAGVATHLFEATDPGYVGWRWAVTVATVGEDEPVTVSEVVLLPGPEALTAPDWVPWSERVEPGDLGAGDLLPSSPDDPRLIPGYLLSDDPAVEEVARDLGLGRQRVPSREGRMDAAERWFEGDFGPDTEMARQAPGACGTCGFFLPLAGSMRAAFGVCSNEVAPADGRVVHVEFGCGAHSEAEVDTFSTVPVAQVVYDDTTLDYESREPAADQSAPEARG